MWVQNRFSAVTWGHSREPALPAQPTHAPICSAAPSALSHHLSVAHLLTTHLLTPSQMESLVLSRTPWVIYLYARVLSHQCRSLGALWPGPVPGPGLGRHRAPELTGCMVLRLESGWGHKSLEATLPAPEVLARDGEPPSEICREGPGSGHLATVTGGTRVFSQKPGCSSSRGSASPS